MKEIPWMELIGMLRRLLRTPVTFNLTISKSFRFNQSNQWQVAVFFLVI